MITPLPGKSRSERAEFVRETKDFGFQMPNKSEIDFDDPDKYARLHTLLYANFMRRWTGQEDQKNYAINQGFMVHGRIVGTIPKAYSDYLCATGNQPDLDALGAVLLEEGEYTSYSATIGKIAGTDSDTNRIYEEYLQLGSTPITGPQLVFPTTPDRLLHYRPNGLMLLTAADIARERTARYDANGEEILEPIDTTRKCPALTHILPKLWKTVITGCLEDPQYFQADIERELKLREANAEAVR